MKGHGLLAGMIIGMLVLASLATAGPDVSIFDNKENARVHKFGIQITGGGGMFAMDDVNNYFLTPDDDIAINDFNEAEFGVGGGMAILFRSHDRFRWHVGYNYLGKDSFEGNVTDLGTGISSSNEHAASGSEFYLAGYYLYPFNDAFHLYFGAGVSIVNAKLDRITSLADYGPAIYDASGSAFGGTATLGAEFMITNSFGVIGAVGYRLANVGTLTYEDVNGTKDENGDLPIEEYVWDAGNNDARKISVDFSGAYGELGLRMYFDAATGWYRP
jgi:opacity protein-like surface antigen